MVVLSMRHNLNSNLFFLIHISEIELLSAISCLESLSKNFIDPTLILTIKSITPNFNTINKNR